VIVKKQVGRAGICKVTFELPAEVGATTAHVCGDFNDWSPTATPMKRRKDGSLAATVALEAGGQYRFRYLLDDGRWENDWAADTYLPNDFGGDDSVIEV
jgi:1,4-alpha-glucan branching enzyme